MSHSCIVENTRVRSVHLRDRLDTIRISSAISSFPCLVIYTSHPSKILIASSALHSPKQNKNTATGDAHNFTGRTQKERTNHGTRRQPKLLSSVAYLPGYLAHGCQSRWIKSGRSKCIRVSWRRPRERVRSVGRALRLQSVRVHVLLSFPPGRHLARPHAPGADIPAPPPSPYKLSTILCNSSSV